MLFENLIVNTFRKQFLIRCDDTGTAYYFSAADFPGLQAEPFAFPSGVGHTLQGYFYHYGDPIPGRIVVFDHGFGGGHRAYMKEIEKLCGKLKDSLVIITADHGLCDSVNLFLEDYPRLYNMLKIPPSIAIQSN